MYLSNTRIAAKSGSYAIARVCETRRFLGVRFTRTLGYVVGKRAKRDYEVLHAGFMSYAQAASLFDLLTTAQARIAYVMA